MIAVFVESNWIYEYCAPAHRRAPDAQRLVERAKAGDIQLLIPAICLREGANAVRNKCQPRLDEMRRYWRFVKDQGDLPVEHGQVVLQFLDGFERRVREELAAIDDRIDRLTKTKGVKVFGLDDAILTRAIELRRVPDCSVLKPFDESILAAVLVEARRLADQGLTNIRFCCLDRDLNPQTKEGHPKRGLARLYADAGIDFQADFMLDNE